MCRGMLVDILEDGIWRMTPGERAAIKGILADMQPVIAIEIGTGQGGSLRRIAASAGRVHAFDVSAPAADLAMLPNVTFHTGDSHELLPRVLAQLANQNADVDFVLVDGDHRADGVQRDVEDLLASPTISHALIVLHDTANPEVRAGLDAIDYAAWPRLRWVDLDWIPGYVFREGPLRGEAWAGLGIMIVDAGYARPPGGSPLAGYAYPAAALLAQQARRDAEDRDAEGHDAEERDAEGLRDQIARLEHQCAELTSSASWRLTGPLRALKAMLRR